ncbi:intraflagellar transport protein 22 homolog [Tubulanus polymorphus]|uniref:intraflagellar transport protein 22 homolog n=1 Tax=Tubulanus polymorphus TaxID=672921 RepID=UPI003DA248AE
MSKTKILLLGPCESGKSYIANFLSEAFEATSGNYRPTHGVRILEFEVTGVTVNGRMTRSDIELWDVSGDRRYEACWPAVAKDSSAIVFVYNPDVRTHERELDSWHTHFAQDLRDTQCIVFAHQKPSAPASKPDIYLSGAFSKIPTVITNLEEDPDAVRIEFTNFLSRLLSAMSEKREQEEINIMNSRDL